MHKKKTILNSLFLIVFIFSFCLSPVIFALEAEYPGNMPTDPTLPEYVKYIYIFIISISGLVALVALILGAIKWMLSEGSVDKIQDAKNQIWAGFSGVAIILLVYLILGFINPQLLFLGIGRFDPLSLEPIPSSLEASPSKAGVVMATKVNLGNHIDFSITEYSAKVSDNYKEADKIEDSIIDEFEESTSRIGMKVNETDNLDPSKEDQEIFRDEFDTKIDDVIDKINEVESVTCEGNNCELYCPSIIGPGSGMGIPCEITGLVNLKQKANEFKNKSNNEFDDVEERLDGANENIQDILNLEDDEYGSYNIDKFSKDFNEDYSNTAQELVGEILNLSNNINIEDCCSNSGRNLVDNRIEELQETIEMFRNGYESRKDLWQITKTSVVFKEELDGYKTLKDGASPDIKPAIEDYAYEGSLAKSRIDRISTIGNEIKKITGQIKKTATVMNAAAAAIAALTKTCNCFFCVCYGFGCAGDPCLHVRPALIAAQVALGSGASTLPALGTRLEKEVEKMEKERTALEESTKELANKLVKSEFMLRNCSGKKGGNYLILLPLPHFLTYKSIIENYGYEIITTDPWPEIEETGDVFSFYCIEGPMVPGLTDGSYNDEYVVPSRKMTCDAEIEVGSLITQTKNIIREEEMMLDQMEKSMEESREIIKEISKDGTDAQNEQAIDFLEDSPLSSGEAAKTTFENMESESLRNAFKKQFASMTDHHIKEINRQIIESLPGIDLLETAQDTIKSMKGGDLRAFLEDYLNSLKNKEKKKITQAIFQAMDGSEIKNTIDSLLANIDYDNADDLWDDIFKKLDRDDKKQFIGNVFGGMQSSEIAKFYNNLVDTFDVETEEEKIDVIKKLLTESLKRTKSNIPDIVLKDVVGETIEERIDKIIESGGIDGIKNIFDQSMEMLENEDLKQVAQGMPPNIIEKAINALPGDNQKKAAEILFNGIDKNEVKDFVLYSVIDPNPAFFENITSFVPDEKIQDLIFEQVKAIGNENINDFLKIANSNETFEPRKFLNDLIFSDYIPLNQIKDLSKKVEGHLKTISEFLGEAIEVMPSSEDLGEIKDAIDKTIPYLENIEDYMKDTTGLIIDEIFTEFPIDQALKETNQFIKEDILSKLPEKTIRQVTQDFLKEEALPEVRNMVGEIINEIGMDRGRRMVKKLIDFVETKEGKIRKDELIQEMLEIINNLSEYNLPENFDQFTEDKKEKLLTEILEEIPDYQLQEIIDSLSEKAVNKIVDDENVKEALGEILKIVPDKKIEDVSQKIINDITKGITEDPSIIHLSQKIKKINNLTNKIFDNLPKSTNDIMKSLMEKIGKAGDKEFKDITNKLFEQMPMEELQELMDMITGFMPGKLLENYLGNLRDDLADGIFDVIEGVAGEGVIEAFSGIFTGDPGLKNNALSMIKQPWKFRCSNCNPAFSWFSGCSCVGLPASLQTYAEVAKRTINITNNNVSITTNQSSASQAIEKNETIIKEEVKEGVYESLRVNRFHIYDRFPSLETNTSFYDQGVLFRCNMAMEYGWIDSCKDPFNLIYCSIK